MVFDHENKEGLVHFPGLRGLLMTHECMNNKRFHSTASNFLDHMTGPELLEFAIFTKLAWELLTHLVLRILSKCTSFTHNFFSLLPKKNQNMLIL